MEGTWPKPETQREGKGSNGAAPEEIYFQEEHPNRVNRSSDPTGIYARTGAEKEGTSSKSEAQREERTLMVVPLRECTTEKEVCTGQPRLRLYRY